MKDKQMLVASLLTGRLLERNISRNGDYWNIYFPHY